MAIEKEIHVKGNQDRIWAALMTKLASEGYKISNTVPQTQIIAERGSKLVSSFVGGTKGGYRTVTIGIVPGELDTQVKFTFNFSALGAGTAFQGAKDEIDKMIQEIQYVISKEEKNIPMEPPKTSLAPTCPKCGKTVSPEFAVCPFCASPLKTLQDNKCSKCGKELAPDFKVCPYCGTGRN